MPLPSPGISQVTEVGQVSELTNKMAPDKAHGPTMVRN